MQTAPAVVGKTPMQINLADSIVTRHGRNFGTVEIWSVEVVDQTPSGVDVVKVTGYQKINAGVCGPWEATYRAGEYVEVVDHGDIR